MATHLTMIGYSGRVATIDGSRGFQPTVGVSTQMSVRRVATAEIDANARGRVQSSLRDETEFAGSANRGLKPTATIVTSLRDGACSALLAIVVLAGVLAITAAVQAQPRPYLGYVYPAGGQQGTTFEIRLGGQGMDNESSVHVSGKGVRAKVVEYLRRMNNEEMNLLKEQLAELKRAAKQDDESLHMVTRIQRKIDAFVQTPACNSISSLMLVEVTIDRDAEPGRRELILSTPRGVSNPVAFHVGQLPEICRKPMLSATLQVLGKEEMALRKRPDDEVEQRISLPCTVNGQIASGEENRYRFQARKGQRLVLSAQARSLVPFIADAVPGWFQPVMAIYDASGKEVAFDDDYRFNPDPVIFFQVPKDGEYVFTITDALYRGREDFVYRVSAGELPFITSIFPLGGHVGTPVKVGVQGWNLEKAHLKLPPPSAGPGIYSVVATSRGFVSNPVPFALDTLPECSEREPNNDLAHAQRVTLPAIINGRIDRPDDWDVFQFQGRGGETIAAEVSARRLDSPLDSLLKITDARGKVLAFNDDMEDPQSGTNTHQADSYLRFKLPADGVYFVHLGDTARAGGKEYAYRLRIGPPRPDFALYAVPSSAAMPSKGGANITLQLVRKDGFAGPVKLALKDPPPGFLASPMSISGTQSTARMWVRTTLTELPQPLGLVIEGRAAMGSREVVHAAVPAEDRMQAFLWRHLVPAARELKVLVYAPVKQPLAKRVRRTPLPPPAEPKPPVASTNPAGAKGKFTKQQVEWRLRQIKQLFEEGLLTEEFNDRKVAECEAVR
jgi:hypothetical protein